MVSQLDRHPHARAVLEPALAPEGRPSHAYLFHGPGGAGKRSVARGIAAQLLAEGSPDPDGARARVASGAHPDLTWVSPSGAHEILVSDIDGPVIAAASKTPFEAQRRVFVIERVDELGDEAANRMLKTLEEPASFVHLILLTDRLAEVLPTIRSRCQLVRFEAPSEADLEADVSALGLASDTALACARLSLGDGERARELATADGQKLLAGAVHFARAALNGRASAEKPWAAMLAGVRARGDVVRVELEAKAVAELELYPKKERRRIETEWTERIRRVRRRVETAALDLALQAVSLWYGDLACLSWKAEDLVRHCDRLDELRADAAAATAAHATADTDEATPAATRAFHQAVELVEDTRMRFQLNVSEELACEALAYRLERVLAHAA